MGSSGLHPFFSQSGNLEASQRTGVKELSCHSIKARAVNTIVVITEELLCGRSSEGLYAHSIDKSEGHTGSEQEVNRVDLHEIGLYH